MKPALDTLRVRALFEQPGFSWILTRLVQRMSRGRHLTGVIANSHATPDERRALDNFLGRRSTVGNHLSLNLAELEEVLRSAGIATCLQDAVTACYGRVENQRAIYEHERDRWSALFDDARARFRDKEGFLQWINMLASEGSLKRLARGEIAVAATLIERASRIITRNSAEEILLPNLAVEIDGDSHALDRGQPLATLCLRAITALHDIDGQRNADARRKAWATLGILVDDLSAPVLVFNLRAAPNSSLAPLLDLHRQQGQPVFFTYRQLRSGSSFAPLDPKMKVVFVCENPSVVSAAAREIGAHCRPLVCTNGQPASAAHLLLSQLREAGAELHCHADFDWAGLRIVDQLVRQHDAVPWRMSAEAYRAIEGTVSVDQQSFSTPWCPDIGEALRARGTAVFEEQVVQSLLSDLGKEEQVCS
jgi:uncharacterized protein (TIGR02679 family)